MKISLVISVFDRHFVFSIGGEVQQEAYAQRDGVELHSQTEIRRTGFQPNPEWEDDEDE